MKYYSTNKQAPEATLEEAVVKGLAADKGLFMPFTIKTLPQEFYDSIDTLSFQEIAYRVADAFFGEDVPADTLKQIVYDTLSFDVPLVRVTKNIYSLELFHGPTLAFKDVGGRFMARLLGYFIKKEGKKQVNVLVATSGDTGSAVANGFLGVEGIHVYVLYPKGKVSEIQEKQFTTLGQNITAIEVDGTFDDCQALVKSAFMDRELNEHLQLTSANSINVARFLPQAFYYFYAYAQLKRAGKGGNAVVCVPSGNFGNITAGLFGKRMGLPVERFIASNNLKWKFIDLGFTFTYSLGGDAFDYSTWQHSNGGSYLYGGAVPTYYDISKMWTGPGDTNATLPKFEYGSAASLSSRWLMPTDYLRLKNLTLGVSIPQNYISKLGLSKARIYFSGSNLLTWKSKDLFVDPEMRVDGLCTFETPALRTYTFGIELNF